MIETTPELAAFMDSASSCIRVDLYTLTLAGGQVLRWSGSDSSVLLPDGRVFNVGPLLERGSLEIESGVAVSELQLSITPRAADVINDRPLLQYAMGGGLRGCTLLLEWAYFDTALALRGVLVKIAGAASPTGFAGGTITLQAKSELERLLVMMPGDVYQASCLNTVYDARCGKSRAAMRSVSAVNAVGLDPRTMFSAPLGQAEGYFDLGIVRFTSGENAGVSRTVRSFVAGVFTVALPLPRPASIGDGLEVLPGCDGKQATCSGKFGNLPRFRGAPYIPVPEVAT